MTTTPTHIVMIATGEYSDHCTTPYRVLKPFTFAEAAEKFKAQFVPEPPRQYGQRPSQFEAWLASNGYIEDMAVHEVHIGSYGQLAFDKPDVDLGEADMAQIRFAPLDEAEGAQSREA